VHPNGLVATAAHVVAGAAVLRVHLADGTNVGAELHAIDPESDLAVLRIPRATPDHLPLAPADVARLGLRVFTLGFPALEILGDDPKFSEGVVSGLGGSASGLLQITVPIQPGSSGAPLITEEGHAVGVVVGAQNADFFQANTGYLPQSVNYAVRSELLARMLPAGLDLPPPVDRAHAIARARAAACWIEALGASTVRHSPRAARFLPRP
jgi:S1-C subfamily serine protease